MNFGISSLDSEHSCANYRFPSNTHGLEYPGGGESPQAEHEPNANLS